MNIVHILKKTKTITCVCSYCRSVKVTPKLWKQIDCSELENSGARISHGACPSCYNRIMPLLLQECRLEATLP